jgi:hypothetical protein
MGVGIKVQKKCHLLFEWPLILSVPRIGASQLCEPIRARVYIRHNVQEYFYTAQAVF